MVSVSGGIPEKVLSLGKKSCSSTASTATELSIAKMRRNGKAKKSLGKEPNCIAKAKYGRAKAKRG